jgi:hypothetical protein
MATSNVQLQDIQTQLSQLGASPVAIRDLQRYIGGLQERAAGFDKTNLPEFASLLEEIHNCQARLASINTPEVQSLMQQEIDLLQILTTQ